MPVKGSDPIFFLPYDTLYELTLRQLNQLTQTVREIQRVKVSGIDKLFWKKKCLNSHSLVYWYSGSPFEFYSIHIISIFVAPAFVALEFFRIGLYTCIFK